MTDWLAAAQLIAGKHCRDYPRIDSELANLAAIEAAQMYELSNRLKAWDFDCWVRSRIWQRYLADKKQEDTEMAAKLSSEEKEEIRGMYRVGDNIRGIAKKYSVSDQLIYNICSDLKNERNQVIAALNAVVRAEPDEPETAEDVQPDTGAAEGTVEPEKDEDTADVPEAGEAPVNIQADNAVRINPYELACGFESFCRENIPDNFKASIYRVGEAITVTVEIGSKTITLTDTGNV